jgi:D-alanyl-D-alanine carboxypeptidase
MTHSRTATNGPEYDLYGLGIGSLHGWWGHTGSGVGFQAASFRDPKTGTTVAVLVNATLTASPGRELNLAQEIFAALANVVDRR